MSANAESLTQDLRLLDLLQNHPELNEPAGVNLRQRLATLCETQGETASPARIAETVVDYLKDQPLVAPAAAQVPWKRPQTKDEWNAAREAIKAGLTAEAELERFDVLARVVAMASGAGFVVACLTLPFWTALPLWVVAVAAFWSPRFFKKSSLDVWRELILKKDEALQTWAAEAPEGEPALICPSWASNRPGWELKDCSVTPFGMRKFKKSPRAIAAFRALQAQPVPLLNVDLAHIERMATQDVAALEKSEEETLKREWQDLLSQP